jgi:signal transduction histidine kinase
MSRKAELHPPVPLASFNPAIMAPFLAVDNTLLNICLNAIQAMPSGGILRAKTSTLNKGRVKISISDTGSGIPEENMERICSPFFSTKEGGIGLGLSITEKLVTELGGKIDLSSITGQGTEFSLIFPRK